MSKKGELKRKIAESEEEIVLLEQKRGRSQSALLEAIISNRQPDPTDVEYFKTFSQLIDLERANWRKLKSALDNL